jgi:hypothetical protein
LTDSSEKKIDPASITSELRLAAATASMVDTGATRQVMLIKSDLEKVIPSGSLLTIRSVKFSNLKMGDFICVRDGSSFAVRRFVKTKMTSSETYLLTAKEGFDKKEPLKRDRLLGRVEGFQHAGKMVDPRKVEGALTRFWGRLTEYGTHKPFGLGKGK